MENLGKVTAFVLMLLAGSLVMLYQAYIVKDLVDLYEIPISLTLKWVFVFIVVLSLINYKDEAKKDTKKKRFEEVMKEGLGKIFVKAFVMSLMWGVFVVLWYWWFK